MSETFLEINDWLDVYTECEQARRQAADNLRDVAERIETDLWDQLRTDLTFYGRAFPGDLKFISFNRKQVFEVSTITRVGRDHGTHEGLQPSVHFNFEFDIKENKASLICSFEPRNLRNRTFEVATNPDSGRPEFKDVTVAQVSAYLLAAIVFDAVTDSWYEAVKP